MDSNVAQVVQDPRRLAALHELGLLDTPAEQAFDRLAKLAARILHTPVALVSLVDSDRQFFKSCLGLPEPWSRWRETPLSHSFCQHVVASGKPLVIPDARRDPVLLDNLAIRDLNVIAYLGSPLILPGGQVVGSFCVIDSKPRAWTDAEISIVRNLAASVMTEINLRHEQSSLERRVQERTSELMAVNQTLRESESRYRELVDLAADGIFISDAGGHFVDINAAGCALSGYTRDEVLHRSFNDLIPEADRERDPPRLDELHAGKTVIQERNILCKDGTIVPVEVSVKQLPSGRLQGIVRDITERHLAEQALRESEARFRATMENVQLLAVGLDAAGNINFCNDFLLAHTGWQREDVLGRNWFTTFLPESVDDTVWKLFKQASGDVPLHFENEITTRTGDLRLVRWNNTVLRDPGGTITGTVSLGEDITDRRHAQEALKQSEQRLRDIIDGLGPSMFVGLLTTEGVVLEANRQALAAAGLKPEDVLGKPVEETYWFSYSEESKRQMREAVARAARGEASRYDLQIRAAENQFIPLDFSVQPFRDATGSVVLLVPSAIVITERKQAEAEREKFLAELTARNIEMENFVYTISHDLKTPLITIGGFASLLSRDLAKKDLKTAYDSLAEINKGVEQMKGHIQDLLMLSRTGQAITEKVPVAIGDLIDSVLDLFQHRLEETNARVDVARDLPVIEADSKGLRRVFTNLIDNALKYRREDVQPVIEIGTTHAHNLIRFFVRDNGVGIRAKYRQRIFDLFQRADSKTEGTGVGLAIARRVIEVHGGRMWVESETGQGSTFWIELPDSIIVSSASKSA